MIRFIIKRLLTLIPLLLAVSVIVFLLLRMGPNDPAMSYLRLSNIPPTDVALAESRSTPGLDLPLAAQGFTCLGHAPRRDCGLPLFTQAPPPDRLSLLLSHTL